MVLLIAACASEGPDFVFQVEATPADSPMRTRVEADLADAQNVVLVGTASGLEKIFLVATYLSEGDDCVIVYEPSGTGSICGDTRPVEAGVIVM